MTDLAKAYFAFWNIIATAYPEGSVPYDAQLPYVVYDVVMSPYSENTPHKLMVYSQSESYEELWGICDKVQKAIPESGKTLYLENNGGSITIYRGTSSFVQNYDLTEEEKTQGIKAAYINMYVRCNIV